MRVNPRDNAKSLGRNIVIGASALYGTYIYVESKQEVPYTRRKHSILVDIATERELGIQAFRQVVQEAKANGTLLSPAHPASKMVRKVGKRIAHTAGDGYGGGYQQQMNDIKWEFAVIKSRDANAFVVPGGKVVVYSGLLQLVDSEDELAAVLAHEVAHIIARHSAERLTRGSVIALVRVLAYYAFGIPLFSGPLHALLFLPNSRMAEMEADTIGLQLAARACYNPYAALTMFEKLGREEAKAGINVPTFLRTHPRFDQRLTNLQQMMPAARKLAESSRCNSSRNLIQVLQYE